jgi:D-Tyr-tRNAtyr deacylase
MRRLAQLEPESAFRQRWSHVAGGIFGADMTVSLMNDGPVTLLLEK